MTITRVIRWLLGLGGRAGGALVIFCGGSAALAASTIRAITGVKLSILHWGDASEDNIVRDLAEEYERQHPDISVVRIHAADYDSKFKTMLAAGTPPDLFYLNHSNTAPYADFHLLMNLDPLIASSPEGKSWLDNFYPNLLATFRYDGKQGGVGPLYGIPKDFTTMLMYVNCRSVQARGLEGAV